jgi:D-alanyl-D-alanine carboxypeptidase
MQWFALALALAFAQAETAPPAPEILTPAAREFMEANFGALAGTGAGQAPALQLAVFEGGRSTFAGAYGAVTPDTRFPIASITKMFTAVAIMQLVEQHRVELNAPVSTYLPSAPHADAITVRQLLQHTSGLWNYLDSALASGLDKKPVTPQGILAYAASHRLIQFPGVRYAYSNTGYVVLGLIVEHVTGMSLAAYEQRAIFTPAGLTATTFGPPPPGPLVAAGHMTASGPISGIRNYSWLYADGDIFSTASDLAKFDVALMNGRLVSAATFALMQSDSVATDEHFRQGLGLMMVDQGGLHFVGHHGGVPGFESDNEMVPSSGVAMTVLASAFNFNTGRVYQVILTAMFPTFRAPDAVANDGRKEDPAITTRFKDALNGLLTGAPDLDQYDQTARDALTPAAIAQVASQLKPLGTIANVLYVSHNSAGYRYRVVFSSGSALIWLLTLGDQGKITRLIVDPQQ